MGSPDRHAGASRAATFEGGQAGIVALLTSLLLLWASALSAQAGCGTTVTVRSGDTLAEIAARCGTTVTYLMRLNDQIGDPDLIRVGWVLTIPTALEQASPEPEGEEPRRETPRDVETGAAVHTVEPGETLALIASLYDTTIRALMGANDQIRDPNLIRVGWELVIPGTGEDEVEPPREKEPGAAYPNAAVRVERERAAPGERMQLTVRSFPPNQRVNLGVGPWRSEYTVVKELRTDDEGRLVAPVRMPAWADPGDRFVFVVEAPRHGLKAVTGPIEVIRRETPPEQKPDLQPGERVRITGTLTGEGVECQALRAENGDLFTLAGDPEGFENGERVRVSGIVAEVSFCQQGTTIEVRDMSSLDESDDLRKLVRVRGRLTDEGTECPALRAEDGTLYTLVGDLEEFGPGDEVYIEGSEVEASVCMQGNTIEVTEIWPGGGRP